MFIFITQDNLNSAIKAEFYNNVIAGLSQTELDRVELSALQTILDKLRQRYDVEAIKTASEKDSRVIQWLIDIMLYRLHKRQNPRGIPDHISADYDATINWLNDIRDGKEHPDLPPLPNNDDGTEDLGSNDLRYGSKPNFEFGEY